MTDVVRALISRESVAWLAPPCSISAVPQ